MSWLVVDVSRQVVVVHISACKLRVQRHRPRHSNGRTVATRDLQPLGLRGLPTPNRASCHVWERKGRRSRGPGGSVPFLVSVVASVLHSNVSG